MSREMDRTMSFSDRRVPLSRVSQNHPIHIVRRGTVVEVSGDGGMGILYKIEIFEAWKDQDVEFSMIHQSVS